MNARLYEPALGRFLSPDPYVQMPDFSQSFNRYTYCLNNPLRYTDTTGEVFGIDDLIFAIIGGGINLVVNLVQGNVHSFAQGASYFGVGAVGTLAGIYGSPLTGGAVIGAGNSLVTQGFGSNGKWNGNNISGQQVLFGGIMGGLTGQIGSLLGNALSPSISNLTSGLGGQAIQQALTQGIIGSATGFAFGTGFALMNGENFGAALKAGGQGALMGLTIGVTSGLASGLRSAYLAKESPWSGHKNALTNDELVYNAGAKADKAVNGTGPVAGTEKHEYAENLINRYQNIYGDRGLQTEYDFNGNYGAGRLDVYSPKTNTIYDWKFGYPNKTIPQFMNTPQMIKYQNSFPNFRIMIFKY